MSLWQEFKAFAFKGNLMELAIAVVIGTAFTAVVTSLVADIIMPMISYIMPTQESYATWTLGSGEKPVAIGKFLAALLNFLLIALTVFIVVVKLLGSIAKAKSPPPPAAPVTKECPLCLSVIPVKAVKCAHCTSDLPA
jgi:large conductance mechanosensitive channel